MHVVDIIWLPQILDKLAWKHRVFPEEVEEVLLDGPLYRRVQIRTCAWRRPLRCSWADKCGTISYRLLHLQSDA